MQSSGSERDLADRIKKSLTKFTFFIFTKEEYSHVYRLLKSLDLLSLTRIRPLSNRRDLFILELDESYLIPQCRSRCSKGEYFDDDCFAECREKERGKLISEVISKLEGSNERKRV